MRSVARDERERVAACVGGHTHLNEQRLHRAHVVQARHVGSSSGSGVSSAAHRIGSAAFLAPETRTSPSSGAPPSMTSLSIACASSGYAGRASPRPFVRRERRHRQRMDLLAHAVAQRRVDQLVARTRAGRRIRALTISALEVLAVAADFDPVAGKCPRSMTCLMLSGVVTRLGGVLSCVLSRVLSCVTYIRAATAPASSAVEPGTTRRRCARLSAGATSDKPKNP